MESYTVHEKCVKSLGASASAIRKFFGLLQQMLQKFNFFVFLDKKNYLKSRRRLGVTLYTKSVSNVSGHLPLQSEKFLDFCSTCYKTWIFSPHFDDQKKLFKIEEESWSHILYTKSMSNVSGHLLVQSENFLDFCKKC